MSEDTTPNTIPDLQSKRWGQISQWLLNVQSTMSWSSEAKSFSEWLDKKARETKRLRSTLWRMVTVGHYYNHIRNHYARPGIDWPALAELDQSVSPESLELVRKLHRIAPAEYMESILARLLTGQITRSELRAAWQTYRPLTPERATNRREHQSSVKSAIDHWNAAGFVPLLFEYGPIVLGTNDSDVFRILPQFTLRYPDSNDCQIPIAFDAVVIDGQRHQISQEMVAKP